jgi:nitrogen fixation protein FixH
MNNASSHAETRGNWIPWIFVAFFGVVLIVNGIMIYIAISTWNGVAAQRSYDKGLAYNRNIEAQKAQEALGWTHRIEVDGEGRLVLAVSDADEAPIPGATVFATLERPNDASLDFATPFEAVGGGRYIADVGDIARGVWNVHLVFEKNGRRLVADERVMMP